jgi:hypothetical protein
MLIHIHLPFHKQPNRLMLIIKLEFRDQAIIKVFCFQKIVAHYRIKVQLKKEIVKAQFLGLISLIIRFLALRNKLCLISFNSESRELNQKYQNKITRFYSFKREKKTFLVMEVTMNKMRLIKKKMKVKKKK